MKGVLYALVGGEVDGNSGKMQCYRVEKITTHNYNIFISVTLARL